MDMKLISAPCYQADFTPRIYKTQNLPTKPHTLTQDAYKCFHNKHYHFETNISAHSKV